MCDSVANGRAGFVVQVDQQEIAPRLADDLCSVQGVNVVGAVYDLVGADAVGVVLEFQEGLPTVSAHLPELTAVPSLPMPAEQSSARVSFVEFVLESSTSHFIIAIATCYFPIS